MSTKKKVRAKKREGSLINKPIILTIQIDDGGKRVMNYKGNLEKGFIKLKGMCVDVFQVLDKEDFNIQSKQAIKGDGDTK